MSFLKGNIQSFNLRRGAAGIILLLTLFVLNSSPAYAGKDCSGAFTVQLSDGRVITGPTKVTITVGAGVTARLSGKFVNYTVDLDTFRVTNYTLRSDITANQPAVIFVRKEPLHGRVLTSGLSIELSSEQAVLQRSGGGQSMKIQSKDCSEGGIFQMEPEPAVEVVHELGPLFAYCVDSLGRVLIVSASNPFIGRESPELATRTFPVGNSIVGTKVSRWQIQSGGRMGMVTGEDAVEPLTAPCSAGGAGPTPTPSPSPSATPTPSPSPTATPSPSPSPTASPSPSPSPSASPSPTPSPSPGQGMEARMEIRLVGATLNGATPSGEAEFRREAVGSRRLRIKIENVNLPDGTVLDVLVDNVRVGQIVINSLKGELELRTDHGQTTPPVVNGTSIVISDRTGTTILAGTFSQSLPNPGATPNPTPVPTPGPGGEVRVRIPLAGAAIGGMMPQGHADFRQRPDGRRLNVEIQDVNLPAGTTFRVLVNNVSIGQIVLNSFFRGELELNTNDGNSVPVITNGTTVAVVNNTTGATVLAGVFGAIAPAVNPLEDGNFFVRQQYLDFLNRAPEQGGLDAWLGVLGKCPNNGYGSDNPDCDRVQISSGFYRSPEFSGRGYFVYRLYDAALGRMPRYAEFMPDMARLGTPQTAAELEASKDAFVAEIMARPEFNTLYNGLTSAANAEAFVAKLERTAGVTLANRAQLIAAMSNGTKTAAQTLRAFIESQEVQTRFFYRGFVAMQYFGYLRRDPEQAGFEAWVNVLTNGAPNIQTGDYRTLIFGFLHSFEYRNRFGQP
ncbi:MAG TPA: hypothetical protein VGX24_13685 [Pyrinomonadaceae bacterium]|jgi:hypothetical protein|nr:hypothetical protein [Pyrinomonadaceae bacterium]